MPGSGPSSRQIYFPNRDRKTRPSDPSSEDTPTNPASGANVVISSAAAESIAPDDDLYYHPDSHEQQQPDPNGKVASYVSFANFDEEAWLKLRTGKKDKGLM